MSLKVGALKKLLENVPDDTKIVVQLQPDATIAPVTGVWGPTREKPSFTIVAKASQKTQPV